MREKVMAACENIVSELVAKGYWQVEDIKTVSVDASDGSVVLRYIYNQFPRGGTCGSRGCNPSTAVPIIKESLMEQVPEIKKVIVHEF